MKRLFIAACLLGATAVHAQEVRNLKEVISGKLARSGSTHQSALSTSALVGLCNQGYTLAVYVYAGGRNETVSCGGGRTLNYVNITGWKSPDGILSRAQSAMNAGGKVLIHCWNGIHASKYVGAAALNKFCGFSGPQAAQYFANGIGSGEISSLGKLTALLNARGPGGSVMSGCPSPR